MMNRLWAAAVMAVLSAGLGRAESTNGHEFVCGDYVQNKVMVIGRDGQVKWEYPAPQVCDLWVLDNANLREPQGCSNRDLRTDA